MPDQPQRGTQPVEPLFDPQKVIVDACLMQYLNALPTRAITISHEEILELSKKYTIRLEILNMKQPEISPIRCSLITLEEARKLMEELRRMKT